MVELKEVEDEYFQKENADDDGDWDTDTDSDVSSVASEEAEDESIFDRITALKDVIPPAQRRRISSTLSTGSSWGLWGLQMTGKSLWVLSASILLLGVPFAVGSVEDQQIAMEEKQMSMQQSANEFMAPGSSGAPQQGQQGQRPL